MASIMVVDDEEKMRHVLGILLENAGHQVHSAASVKEAQSLLQAHAAEVLISDIRMTPETGFDLLEWVQDNYPDLPVILITGNHTIDNAAEALRLGVFEYLTKPVEPTDLLQVVERALKYARFLEEQSSVHGKIKG